VLYTYFTLVTSFVYTAKPNMENFNNPFDLIEFEARSGTAGRGPGSELDHPGGPLYVPLPRTSSSSYYSEPRSHVSTYVPPQQYGQPLTAAGAPPSYFPQPPPRIINVQLPPFWNERPLSWFSAVEARFRLHHVVEEQIKFDLLVTALPQSAAAAVADAIDRPPLDYPYTALKHRLLEAHELSDYQKLEHLFKLGPMGGRRPSELLTAMLEFCPRGEENNRFFTHMFLQRLPAELRILLGEDDHRDPRPLAVKADQLWAVNGARAAHIAAVADGQQEPAQVAAIASRQPTRGGKKRSSGRTRPAATSGVAGASQAAVPPANTPMELSQIQSGLCYKHWRFGEAAHSCQAPCSWGN